MYSVDDDSICEVVLGCRMYGQRILTVRHYELALEGGGSYEDGRQALELIADALDVADGGITDTICTYTTEEFFIDFIQCQWIKNTRWAYFRRPAVNNQGTVAQPSLPQNTTCVATLQADGTGRHARGNLFQAGFPADSNVDGLLSGLAKGHLQEIADDWVETLAPGVGTFSMYPIIYQRAAPAASQRIVHATVQDQLRVMGRRTYGRGE